jgi:hypothetical protein
VFDESLRVLRSALVDDSASYYGRYFTVSAAADRFCALLNSGQRFDEFG